MALPQQHARLPDRLGVEAAERLVRIPHRHQVERHAHLVGGVAAEVLVGQEDDLLAARPRPLERRPGVAGRADDAAVLADERFDARRRVDVGDGDHGRGDADRLEILPRHLELLGLGHVGHRAAGGEVGQDHLLVRRGQDVRALGHEVDAAEDDELGVLVVADALRQLPRVADVVGELDHLVALVVVAEDDEALAEGRPRRRDAAVHLLDRQAEVALRERLPLADVLVLELRQDVDRTHGSIAPAGERLRSRSGVSRTDDSGVARARKRQEL